ncbi:MAG: radical SAM protein [Sandaracinaceae bacterium]|nr:radical SAM protein [Sandaracinaceae bacterium]
MTPSIDRADEMLKREQVANRPKHWVRAVTACNSRCLFCLDMDTPRNVFVPEEDVRAELRRGIEVLGAEKVIISGGEASLHPKFIDFIAYAKELGYDRVQTVTNGFRFADPAFLEASLAAGLGEITYSIHGHTAQLHDHLTQTKGAFRRITKAIARSVRDGRPVVNVDVCINKQNVGELDKLVELCIQLGVTEFDLLHVIPQAAAYDNRADLFYDPIEHLPTLHKVFRLNRHPRFVVWTNRFPVPFLEGLEDLIQDPHKMLDEINGRRHQVRRYLDTGEKLDRRDPERCQHCFIEPLCNTVDEVVQRQIEASWDVWWVGTEPTTLDALPFGCTQLGVEVDGVAAAAQRVRPASASMCGPTAKTAGRLGSPGCGADAGRHEARADRRVAARRVRELAGPRGGGVDQAAGPDAARERARAGRAPGSRAPAPAFLRARDQGAHGRHRRLARVPHGAGHAVGRAEHQRCARMPRARSARHGPTAHPGRPLVRSRVRPPEHPGGRRVPRGRAIRGQVAALPKLPCGVALPWRAHQLRALRRARHTAAAGRGRARRPRRSARARALPRATAAPGAGSAGSRGRPQPARLRAARWRAPRPAGGHRRAAAPEEGAPSRTGGKHVTLPVG